jgi:hypothetical protein
MRMPDVWLFGARLDSFERDPSAEIVEMLERRDWDGKTYTEPCTCGHNRWEHDRAGRCAVGSIGYEVPGWVHRVREALNQPQPDRTRPLCGCATFQAQPRPPGFFYVVASENT